MISMQIRLDFYKDRFVRHELDLDLDSVLMETLWFSNDPGPLDIIYWELQDEQFS